jgi:integrase
MTLFWHGWGDAMTVVRVKGLQKFSDRHGKKRCYIRRGKDRIGKIDLEKAPLGTPEFFAEYSRIAAQFVKTDATKPGTLGLLIERYRASPAFLQDIRDRTRSDYQKIFNYLKAIDDIPITSFSTPLIVKLRDKAAEKHGRRFGSYVKQVLSMLFSWGRERGFMRDNPAKGVSNVKRDKSRPQPNRRWADSEMQAVLNALPLHMKPVVALMMFTGMDPQDAVALPRSAYQNGKIDNWRRKTGESQWWPAPAILQTILDDAPAHDAPTLCANSFGKAWTLSGYRASWAKVRIKLEASGAVSPGLTLKGLRHTMATILAEMGYDDRTVADALGHQTLAMAQHYSRHANRARKMEAVSEKFNIEMNERQERLSNPFSETVKLEGI